MVQTTVSKGCDYLGRIPANVKFQAEKPIDDGAYLSCIYPSGKLRKKGCRPIMVRVIEYTIEHPENPTEQLTYRLITSLLDIKKFPAELLAKEYHQRSRSRKYHWWVENPSCGAKNSCSFPKTTRSCTRSVWLVIRTLVSQSVNVSSCNWGWSSTITSEFYRNITGQTPVLFLNFNR